MDLTISSCERTQELGFLLGKFLRPGDTVLLKGDLGTGKSVLVRAAARALGVEGAMPSPTFTLMQPYTGKNGVCVCHYDLYRLEDSEEFYAVGLDEPIGRDICLVEWPMEDVDVSEPRIDVRMERCGEENARHISLDIRGFGVRTLALEDALAAWKEKNR